MQNPINVGGLEQHHKDCLVQIFFFSSPFFSPILGETILVAQGKNTQAPLVFLPKITSTKNPKKFLVKI